MLLLLMLLLMLHNVIIVNVIMLMLQIIIVNVDVIIVNVTLYLMLKHEAKRKLMRDSYSGECFRVGNRIFKLPNYVCMNHSGSLLCTVLKQILANSGN